MVAPYSASKVTSQKRPLQLVDYIPSSTWQGRKAGFYFGTADQGTGYYRDGQNDGNTVATIDGSEGSDSHTPAEKKLKRSVRIAEEHNETRVMLSGDDLLKQAEFKVGSVRVVDLTRKGIRAAALSLERVAEKNELQRVEYADQPEQYMESEVSLYENIHALKAVAADPLQLYPLLDESGILATLMRLLAHENADVAAAVVGLLLEWIDVSLLEMNDDDETAANVDQMRSVLASLVAAFLKQGGSDLLVSNLSRNSATTQDNEYSNDEVGKGPEDILSLIENLLELDLEFQSNGSGLAAAPDSPVALIFCRETTLVSWLIQQLDDATPLKDRAIETLAVIAPREEVYEAIPNWRRLPPYKSLFDKTHPPANGDKKQEPDVDAIEVLLQFVAVFRKKQPETDLEVESLENVCMVLASLLTYSPDNVRAFLEAQGIELLVRCLKEKVHSGGVALKWLDFTGSDPIYQKACEHAVEAGILKYLLPLLMGRNLPTKASPVSALSKKAKKEWRRSIETTTIRILYGLTRFLPEASPTDAKQRVLAKFLDEEKCDRLVELLLAYDQKAQMAEYKFFRSDVEDRLPDEEAVQLAALNAKLSGGGEIFHRLGAIIAFCCSGSKRCYERIMHQLREHDGGIGTIRASVEEFSSVIADSKQKEQLKRYLESL